MFAADDAIMCCSQNQERMPKLSIGLTPMTSVAIGDDISYSDTMITFNMLL